MGRLRGRGLGGLCSSAQGAPTWASTAHGGHSRDGPTVAVYGGTDTGVTQQPHVGAQAELSRAPRRGLSAADSEVWVGTVSVCLRAGLCTATLTLPPGPQHRVPSAGRGILPPPTLLPPAGGCQQRHSAPSPTGFLLYPPEDATISWQHFGAADALCMGPVWGPWHPLGAQQTHYLHPTAPSPREGPCGSSQPPTSLLLGDTSALCVPAALCPQLLPHTALRGPAVPSQHRAGSSTRAFGASRDPGLQEEPWGGSENWVAPCTWHRQAVRGLCSAAAPNLLYPQLVPCPRWAQHWALPFSPPSTAARLPKHAPSPWALLHPLCPSHRTHGRPGRTA